MTNLPQRLAARLVAASLMAAAMCAVGGTAAADAPEERPVPDYDGRGDDPTTAGDVAIWVPRLVLSPLYLVSEYGVRRPLGWVVSNAEQHHVPMLLYSFFTFADGDAGLVPTAFVEFGFQPSVGFYFWYDHFLFEENRLRVHGATWGPDWLRITVGDRIELDGDRREIGLRGEATHRPDGLFYGIGPDSRESDESRYQYDQLDARLHYTTRFWRSSAVSVFAGARRATFGDDVCCDDPSIDDRIASGQMTVPPGYPDGYAVWRWGAELAFDTRRPRPARGTGVRLELGGEQSADVSDPTSRGWVRYGASAGGYLDLTGQNRTLGLSVHTAFADPFGSGEVPFTEMVTVGGEAPRTELVTVGRQGPLRGFHETRLLGRSAAAAALEYRWPIWVWLDGTMHFAMGNVFGAHLAGFDPDLLRMSFGLGVSAPMSRDHTVDFLVAAGTEPIGDGASITSFRLVLGANRGF